MTQTRKIQQVTVPEGTHLAYIVTHEAWYWRGSVRDIDSGRHSINIMASAKGQGGGVAWEFSIVEYDLQGTTLRLEMFADAFAALRGLTSFFEALAGGHLETLDDVRESLDAFGAIDETERQSPYANVDMDPQDATDVPLTRRDLEQILTALENRGDHRNDDPRWKGLVLRLHDLAVAVDDVAERVS